MIFGLSGADDARAEAARAVVVVARGGRVLEGVVLPNGDRIAPCEDPQGAAFGLLTPAKGA
jgi:predicted enzyme related to lactoylglutathione lyase